MAVNRRKIFPRAKVVIQNSYIWNLMLLITANIKFFKLIYYISVHTAGHAHFQYKNGYSKFYAYAKACWLCSCVPTRYVPGVN